ncbi:hypothetical protein RAN53_10045 [Halomonas sp. SSL-5]|uniref:hypothetical protein n=1 Tax=Halomonas sp. SSL-5 TaxID=3065855 RepID=UPI00273A31B3|nr:hypothetical protein [Halomonas sp. SSL-5]MDY7116693.1 hypothetical protein [Halomonas sp. SSL-5]
MQALLAQVPGLVLVQALPVQVPRLGRVPPAALRPPVAWPAWPRRPVSPPPPW